MSDRNPLPDCLSHLAQLNAPKSPVTALGERDEALCRATDAVRDEFGSHLCHWVADRYRRCTADDGLECRCKTIAEAALEAAWPEQLAPSNTRPAAPEPTDLTTLAIRTGCRHRRVPPNGPEACSYPQCGCHPMGVDQRVARAVLAAIAPRVRAEKWHEGEPSRDSTRQYIVLAEWQPHREDFTVQRWCVVRWGNMQMNDENPYWEWSVPGYSCSVRVLKWMELPELDWFAQQWVERAAIRAGGDNG